MTQRLYYADAYCITFSAHVVQRLTYADKPAVVLDRTCFYPTGGGQPCDRGWLYPLPNLSPVVEVVDVIASEDDGNVLHLLSEALPADDVEGRVDWARRFDHMQQHTGQHILSQAFLRAADAETVSFHLGTESVTIDLNGPHLSPAQVEQAEALANEVVFGNQPVRARFVSAGELATLPLRRQPQVNGAIRVVAIGDFDVTPCGGTHVAHTGEVGLIKVIGLDKRGEETRIEFRCGRRALADYGHKNQMVNQVAAMLSTGHGELDRAVQRLQAEARQLRHELRAAQERLMAYEAAELWTDAETVGGLTIVRHVFSQRDPAHLRQLATHLIAHPKTVALLGLAGPKSQLVFARSEDVTADMVVALKAACRVLGTESGGGRPHFAQGGGPAATETQIAGALERAQQAINNTDER